MQEEYIQVAKKFCQPKLPFLNKQETFQKLDGNVLDKIKDFEKQGFHFVCLKFLLYIYYGIYDLVKN